MSIFAQPELWESSEGEVYVSPPPWWEAIEEDGRWWFYNQGSQWGSQDTTVFPRDPLENPVILEEDITLRYEVVEPTTDSGFTFIADAFSFVIPNEVGIGTFTIPAGTQFTSWRIQNHSNRMYSGVVALGADDVQFNCECEAEDGTVRQTLAQLQRRLLIRLGYAAQADNPPPGMAALLQDFLFSSQMLLYERYTPLRTRRFFTWTMTPGSRFYGITQNEDDCLVRLNARKLSWVGVEDPNFVWLPLAKGIPPEFYTSVTKPGLPFRYDVRQCIEVFPAPDKAYRLRIKGDFGLERFEEPEDRTTIDSELVLLWALATAKAHYGHADADAVAGQANTYLGMLLAGQHGTARHVPGADIVPAWPRPIFLPVSNQ